MTRFQKGHGGLSPKQRRSLARSESKSPVLSKTKEAAKDAFYAQRSLTEGKMSQAEREEKMAYKEESQASKMASPRTALKKRTVNARKKLKKGVEYLQGGEVQGGSVEAPLAGGNVVPAIEGGAVPAGLEGGKLEGGKLEGGAAPAGLEGGKLEGGKLEGGSAPAGLEGGKLEGGAAPAASGLEGGELEGGGKAKMPVAVAKVAAKKAYYTAAKQEGHRLGSSLRGGRKHRSRSRSKSPRLTLKRRSGSRSSRRCAMMGGSTEEFMGGADALMGGADILALEGGRVLSAYNKFVKSYFNTHGHKGPAKMVMKAAAGEWRRMHGKSPRRSRSKSRSRSKRRSSRRM